MRLYNLLLTFDLPAMLGSVLSYLSQLKISHLIRLNDIGLTKEGNIKVFIPPVAIVDGKSGQVGDKSLEFVCEWWCSMLKSPISNPFKREKKAVELQPPKLMDNCELDLDDE